MEWPFGITRADRTTLGDADLSEKREFAWLDEAGRVQQENSMRYAVCRCGANLANPRQIAGVCCCGRVVCQGCASRCADDTCRRILAPQCCAKRLWFLDNSVRCPEHYWRAKRLFVIRLCCALFAAVLLLGLLRHLFGT